MNRRDEDNFRDACTKFDADAAIKWIKDNCTPSDVFGDKVVREHVCDTWEPSDIFSEKVLNEWARLNGFVKEVGPG